jgi:hypothetical protein
MNSETERLGYPKELSSKEWYIYPSDYWPKEQMKVTNELNDIENYRKYHELITRLHRKFTLRKKPL